MTGGPKQSAQSDRIFWEEEWRRRREASLLQRTQALSPEKWSAFYNRVSDLWDEITGTSGPTARRVAAFIEERGWCKAGDTFLDIGCGPGNLALALAAKSVKATALDNAAEMIQALQRKIEAEKITGIRTVAMDWRSFSPTVPYDLVAACFFPDALSPEGLRRMESFAAGRCLLALGAGKDAFPIRRQLWRQIMASPLPEGGHHFDCALNYLRTAGRDPATAEFSVPVHLDTQAERLEQFYQDYFAIFDRTGPSVHPIIAETVSSYAALGRVCIEGRAHIRILTWTAPPTACRKTPTSFF